MHRFYDPSISENSSVISATELEDFKSLRIRDGVELSITKGVTGVLGVVTAWPLRDSQGRLDNLESQGFLGVRLGSSVLPNSMAGPAANSPLMALSGHWS